MARTTADGGSGKLRANGAFDRWGGSGDLATTTQATGLMRRCTQPLPPRLPVDRSCSPEPTPVDQAAGCQPPPGGSGSDTYTSSDMREINANGMLKWLTIGKSNCCS